MTNTRSRISALIGLNGALLGVLALVVLTPPVGGPRAGAAQGQASDRARGSYTMVGGRIIGSPEAAIYILDGANQELIAAKWDRARKALRGLGYQSIAGRAAVPTAPPDAGR